MRFSLLYIILLFVSCIFKNEDKNQITKNNFLGCWEKYIQTLHGGYQEKAYHFKNEDTVIFNYRSASIWFDSNMISSSFLDEAQNVFSQWSFKKDSIYLSNGIGYRNTIFHNPDSVFMDGDIYIEEFVYYYSFKNGSLFLFNEEYKKTECK